MRAFRITLTTTNQEIVKLSQGGSAIIAVPVGGSTVVIGGAGLTAATGFEVTAGTGIPWSAATAESIYGRISSGTQVVHVLVAGEAT